MSSIFKTKKENILNDLFIIAIIIKGLDGILELIFGFIIIFIQSSTIPTLIEKIFQKEILEDPTDIVANYFIQLSHNLSLNTISFITIYLLINGAIKLGLSAGLFYKKLWAYPLAGILLSLFVIFQLIRFFHTHSLLLLFLTIIDILIIALLRFEYKRLKKVLKPKTNTYDENILS